MKSYTLEVTADDNGHNLIIKGTTNGFSAFELLGFLDWQREDIIAQTKGDIKPDYVERIVEREEPK